MQDPTRPGEPDDPATNKAPTGLPPGIFDVRPAVDDSGEESPGVSVGDEPPVPDPPDPRAQEPDGAAEVFSDEESVVWEPSQELDEPSPPYSDSQFRVRERFLLPIQRRGFWRTAAIPLLAALVGALIGSGLVLWLDRPTEVIEAPPVTIVERVQTEIVPSPQLGTSAAAVARRVRPSIATVEIGSGDSETFVAEGSGSGVVFSDDGLLITNEHVVADSEGVRVIFPDGRAYSAEVVGTDPLTDLAVIQIDATGLTPIELGSLDEQEIGDLAIAVGSPLGLEGGPSVTVGVISAFDRRVGIGTDDELFGMLQTDAPITRGSSGGALVDSRGRLIGITTAIGVSDVGAEGLGFAIPVGLVTRIAQDLIEFGRAKHAFLGITGSTFFEQTEDGATVPAGVIVAGVLEETAAEADGLEPGDRIITVDGEEVTTMERLVVGLRSYRVGDQVAFQIDRNGTPLTITITLQERPQDL
ncbi:MAG: S1C family serine protease [Acidimicrobiia bacterium]